MKIGILQAGDVNPALRSEHGEYPDMFVRLLSDADPSFTFESWRVLDEVYPDSVHDADAWIVTGSKHGVYENLPWMLSLQDFLKVAMEARVPVVGICFGHQILAQAMGGRAAKYDRGWGVGPHEYALNSNAPGWLAADGTFMLHAMHQDQVVDLPEGAEVIAESEFCPYAALAYGKTAVSLQGHPEFDAGFMRALVDLRRGNGVPEALADAALARTDGRVDERLPGHWLAAFIRQAHQERAAGSDL